MPERRRFVRVRYEARCILTHDNSTYEGLMVNISLGGAMISFSESVMIPQGEMCALEIYADSGGLPALIEVETVYTSLSCIGVRFVNFDEQSHPQFYKLVGKLSRDPGKYKVSFD
jgi:hypothetical protein